MKKIFEYKVDGMSDELVVCGFDPIEVSVTCLRIISLLYSRIKPQDELVAEAFRRAIVAGVTDLDSPVFRSDVAPYKGDYTSLCVVKEKESHEMP